MFIQSSYTVEEKLKQNIWAIHEVKNFLRISHSYDDNMINNIISAAIESAENFLGLNLTIKNIEAKFYNNQARARVIDLKYTPVIKITHISSHNIDDSANAKISDHDKFEVRDNLLFIDSELGEYDFIKIKYQIGMDKDLIPESIKLGILQHVATMYDRSDYSSISLTPEITNLYLPYRKVRI